MQIISTTKKTPKNGTQLAAGNQDDGKNSLLMAGKRWPNTCNSPNGP